MSEIKKSGYVAIVGRPNVGKSTLLNCLVGEKVSITSSKPQTTRWQIMGIKNVGQHQIIYVDTPGIHQTEKRAMNRYLNRLADGVLPDADVIVFVVDATVWDNEDQMVLEKVAKVDKPVILVVNKIDLLPTKADILPVINKLKDKFDFLHIIPLSAAKDEGVESLEAELVNLLPDGPALFPEDQVTDKSIQFQIAEIVREKLINATEEEVPYVTAVEVEEYSESDKLIEAGVVIWVERQGQKVIVIGKQGSRLKKIGTQARKELEFLLGKKVFLRLWVKVKENWTDDDRALKGFGYD